MAAVQTNQLENLEVREAGRALKVQTDNPHLVSLGSGRLSTTVTLHPLPEGKVTLGTSQDADIIIQGTGVEPRHCIIENQSNIVTLFPIADMTTVDGLKVTSPTRLSQGSMICIGRSNYLRFNHPAEAKLMKSYLPNTRISMAAPLNFFGNGDNQFERKPPVAPPRRSRDSWDELSNSSGNEETNSVFNKVSKFEYLAQSQNQGKTKSISPKVFPLGSATVNSPASVVLGHSRIPNGLVTSPSPVNSPISPVSENGSIDYIEAPIPQTISSYPQKPMVSYSQPQHQVIHNGFGNPLFANYEGTHRRSSDNGDNYITKTQSPKTLTMPSPAFNRNPSPYVPDRFRSVTPNMFSAKTTSSPNQSFSPRSITPSPSNRRPSSSEMESNRLMSRSHDSRVANYNQDRSIGEFNARQEEAEIKMIQAQTERKREQEAQLLEKQRLEEILTMCAEYERQAQHERQTKPPTTPTLQQNRIKTNGSLPRDKRSNGLSSPLANSNSEDELNQIFTFETSKSLPRNKSHPYENLRFGNNRLHVENSGSLSKSPYENLSRQAEDNKGEYDITSVISRHVYVENTLIINPQRSPDGEKPIHPPQSPRTRIRTTCRDQQHIKDQSDISNQLAILNDYDSVDSIQLRNTPANIQRRKFLTPSQQLNKFSNLNNLVMAESISPIEGDKFILPLNDSKDLNDLMDSLEKEFSTSLSEFRNSSKSSECNGVKKEDSWLNDELNNDLPESERDIHVMVNSEEKKKCEEAKEIRSEENGESFRRHKKVDAEVNKMKGERSKWLNVMSKLKSDVHDIEQQEEEILREVKMERALLNAEYLAQKEKYNAEEKKLNALKEKQKQLDIEIEHCQVKDFEVQTKCRDKIQALENELKLAENSLGDHKEFSEDYKNLLDKLESEKKYFEDLEFKHLEEEANWLATKEEHQREIHEISERLESKRRRLEELDNQILEMEKSSQNESSALEIQKIQLLKQLEEVRQKLKDLDVRLSQDNESGQDNSSETDEACGSYRLRPKSKQSQEDLDRISKVTTDAPIDIGKTGSLGRKTLESLKEIERNRQLHLAKQGVQVIEEERKRVEQLKRRVQDEVRAQWEQSRQRECNSLNSVGSEESSLTCSDQPTESGSSDDVDKALPSTLIPPIPEGGDLDSSEEIRGKDSEGADYRNSRPISDYSGSEYEQQLIVKKRDAKPTRLMQQRPLTRYLPIRSETLNLRQHIESAGHQIDLCHHVSIDATSCRGHLHKLGGKFHHWNKRWFVFDRIKRALMYYADKSEKKPRGGTFFQAIEEVYVDHLNSVKSPSPQLTFVIKTRERTYHLMAPSPEAMRIWVDVIFTGAEGYQEFEHGS